MRVFHSKDPKGGGGRVFLAVPAYGNPPPEFLHSMWNARKLLLDEGLETELYILSGGCHVDDTRNQLVTAFLESDCYCMVFIDDDTRFNAHDLLALIKHKAQVVAGVCPKKKEPLEFAYTPLDGMQLRRDGLVEVKGVGTAFMKIHRTVLPRLIDNVSTYQTKIAGVDKTVYEVFERTTVDGARWGGDYHFCQKWRAAGGKVYVDPEMFFGHVGKHEWSGSLGHHLREAQGLTGVYIAGKLRQLKDKRPTAQDLIGLSQAWGNSGWSASNDLLAALDTLARGGKGTILELGSGLSTLIMAASGRRVEAIEHDKDWADKVLYFANAAGLDVMVVDTDIEDGWYSLRTKANDVSMLFIDGPPRHLADRSKVAIRVSSLKKGCVVVADDIDEGEVLTRLSTKYDIPWHRFGNHAIGAIQ